MIRDHPALAILHCVNDLTCVINHVIIKIIIIIIIIIITRKHRQLYQHTDQRRQQQHTAVAARFTSNCATVTVFVTV